MHELNNTESKEILLSVRSIEKSFPVKTHFSRKLLGHIRAVNGVSFDLHKNEVIGLVGESGCGKSTVGYLILQLEKPTGGEIWFKNRNIVGLSNKEMKPIRREMQMIFQDSHSSLNPQMTIREIIKEPLSIHGFDKEYCKRRVDELLDLVGLTKQQAERYPHEFSGGQRQRVGIARALALNPSLIVADEPVSALDVSIQAQIINLLISLQQELGLSYLFITHDLSVARHISNRVAVMYLGKMVEIADKKDLYDNPLHPYTKSLLAAVPIPDPSIKRSQNRVIGDMPSPLALPAGCHYHTRCPFATERCRMEEPPLSERSPGHHVACWL